MPTGGGFYWLLQGWHHLQRNEFCLLCRTSVVICECFGTRGTNLVADRAPQSCMSARVSVQPLCRTDAAGTHPNPSRQCWSCELPAMRMPLCKHSTRRNHFECPTRAPASIWQSSWQHCSSPTWGSDISWHYRNAWYLWVCGSIWKKENKIMSKPGKTWLR